MNVVILMGRVVKDPEVRNANGKNVASYTLAVDRQGKKDEADFIRCVAWEKKADFAEKFLRKGTKIVVEGSLRTGSYTDKDGKKVFTTDVVVYNHEFCEKRQDQPEEKQEQPEEKPSSIGDGFMDFPTGNEEQLPWA